MSEPPVLTGSVVSGSRKYSGVDMTELSKAVEEWSASLPEDLSEFRTDHSVLERFLVAALCEQAIHLLKKVLTQLARNVVDEALRQPLFSLAHCLGEFTRIPG